MVLMQGPLLKWTNMMKGYQQRWFVLDEINGLLLYYTSPEKLIRGERRGYLRLRDAILGIEDDDDTIFSITSDTEVFHCKAHSMKERDEWINRLADTIELFQRKRRKQLNKQFNQQQKSKSFSFNQPRLNNNNNNNNNDLDDEKILKEFNKYLIETDSYLQLLIKQFNKLNKKINDNENNDDNVDRLNQQQPEQQPEQEQLKLLKKHSTYFLDSIKHTIVLLQIAKNLKFPVNGIYSPNNKQQTQQQKIEQKKPEQQEQQQKKSTIINDNKQIDNLNQQTKSEQIKQIAEQSEQQKVPQSSSSSSFDNYNNQYIIDQSSDDDDDEEIVVDVDIDDDDDDDDFFDANDESDSSSSSIIIDKKMPSTISDKTVTTTTSVTTTTTTIGTSSNNNNNNDNEKIFDKLYDTSDNSIDNGNDNDDDDELCSMQSHGSVISHLISQVKIGMDLTKVALPTFILERRSLLEMYADFFAHADIFSSIPDYKTPEERMIQVTKWYLSAFHAGRKGSIAKKPYNPILGEMFKCYWNLNNDNNNNNNNCDDNNRLLPWAKNSDLIFIAEQVSHHPPISAFYAENYNKRIMCSAQIWTKSKFLGLSIGVNNIGYGTINLLDHDEEYICTFPSAYGRSILTEPWFEFGGNVQIECKKSGYTAKIDFLTKPFYGGKRNRINAEIFKNSNNDNKKILMTITGEWNGKMEIKYLNNNMINNYSNNNYNNNKTKKFEIFIDTKTLPIIKKFVKPINEQDEYESRNLWKYVTYSLKNQNVDDATESKYKIEQKQRELCKEREQQGIKWQNRMFHNIGNDKWLFNDPLTKRLQQQR